MLFAILRRYQSFGRHRWCDRSVLFCFCYVISFIDWFTSRNWSFLEFCFLRFAELENEIESTFDDEIGLGAGIELLNHDDGFCGDCLSNLLRWLVDCGCDLDASAYRRAELIVRRRRLSADAFFLRFDVFRRVFRIDREHFVELSELLLPDVEYVRCANGTCAERLEAIMLVFMRLTRPRSQVL